MHEDEFKFSFKTLFIPFTPFKAIHYIILVGLIVYSNGLFNAFIGDDFLQITNNIPVHSLWNIGSFFLGSTFYNGQGRDLLGVYFKPFLSTAYALIYMVSKDTPFGYHLVQLAAHITNTAFLYLVFRYFLKNSTAFFLSLLFLIHPINSQAVYYIAALQEPLFFFFGILAFWIVLRFRCEKYLGLVSLLLLFSVFSKETGILFFALTILYIVLYQRKYLKLFFIYITIPLTLYVILRFHAVGLAKNPHITPINDMNLLERIEHIPSILMFYFNTFFYPAKLSWTNNWAYTVFNYNNFYFPLIEVLLFFSILGLIFVFIKKKSLSKYVTSYIFFSSVFISGLLLHMQIISLDMITCESWFYFTIIGLLGLLGIIYEIFFKRLNNVFIVTICLLILVGLGARTIVRGHDWGDEKIMNQKDLEFNADNYAALSNKAMYLYQDGKLDNAKQLVEASINRYPRAVNYNLLGLIYFEKGDYKKAKEAYQTGLNRGGYQIQYESMAQLDAFYGDPEENIKFIQFGLEKYPQDAALWQFLAIVAYKQGNYEEAKSAIQKAYSLDQGDQIAAVYAVIVKHKKLLLSPKNLQH